MPKLGERQVLLDDATVRVERYTLGAHHKTLVYGRGANGQVECLLVIDETGRVAPTDAVRTAA